MLDSYEQMYYNKNEMRKAEKVWKPSLVFYRLEAVSMEILLFYLHIILLIEIITIIPIAIASIIVIYLFLRK